MTSDSITTLARMIDADGLPAVLNALGEICKCRANVLREGGGDLDDAAVLTRDCCILFNAANDAGLS